MRLCSLTVCSTVRRSRAAELQLARRPDGSDWLIGSGGFGRVYKALRNGVQPVAVKIIPVRMASIYAFRQRTFHHTNSRADPAPFFPFPQAAGALRMVALEDTRREVAILRACHDANIVQFQGAYMGETETMLVTEFMDGGDLARNIQAGRVTWWRRGRKIATDVARGLVFLHRRRIVHFDIKAANVLLARDGTAKIADVGMARLLARDYISGVVATLAWSAPEMLWGAKCSEKADIYSFGIVLWEICTGEVPERGRLRDIRCAAARRRAREAVERHGPTCRVAPPFAPAGCPRSAPRRCGT